MIIIKKSGFLILLSFSICLALKSQVYNGERESFIYNKNTTYSLFSVDSVDDEMYLKKTHVVGNRTIEKKIGSLKIEGCDLDMCRFGDFIDKNRKFLIIPSRYSFYILNFYNDKIIGPLKPKFIGIGEDSQSGMLSQIKIMLEGRFIIGFCVDSGVFLFDLTDLYHPVETNPVTNPYLNQSKLFVLDHLDKVGKKFGLFVKSLNWEASAKVVFTNKEMEYEEYDCKNLTEAKIEAEIENTNIVDQRYSVLKEKQLDNHYNFIVFDNYTGNQLPIPKNLKNSTFAELEKYLKSLQ